MAADRSDRAIVGRLIERTRLLIALSDEIPVETKLNTQALLKMFESGVGEVLDASGQAQVALYHRQIYEDLQDYADVEALLSAMKVFVPYL